MQTRKMPAMRTRIYTRYRKKVGVQKWVKEYVLKRNAYIGSG